MLELNNGKKKLQEVKVLFKRELWIQSSNMYLNLVWKLRIRERRIENKIEKEEAKETKMLKINI